MFGTKKKIELKTLIGLLDNTDNQRRLEMKSLGFKLEWDGIFKIFISQFKRGENERIHFPQPYEKIESYNENELQNKKFSNPTYQPKLINRYCNFIEYGCHYSQPYDKIFDEVKNTFQNIPNPTLSNFNIVNPVNKPGEKNGDVMWIDGGIEVTKNFEGKLLLQSSLSKPTLNFTLYNHNNIYAILRTKGEMDGWNSVVLFNDKPSN